MISPPSSRTQIEVMRTVEGGVCEYEKNETVCASEAHVHLSGLVYVCRHVGLCRYAIKRALLCVCVCARMLVFVSLSKRSRVRGTLLFISVPLCSAARCACICLQLCVLVSVVYTRVSLQAYLTPSSMGCVSGRTFPSSS